MTPSSTRSSRWPLRASASSIFDASSTVSEVLMAAAVGVSLPRCSRAPRSSFSLMPGTDRRDSSCAAMARLICRMRSTGATTPIPRTATQTMPTSASPLSITNPTDASRMKMHQTPTPIAARILISTAHLRECRLRSVREPRRSDAPCGISPSCFCPRPALPSSPLSAALSRVYAKTRPEDSRPTNESPGPTSRGPGLFPKPDTCCLLLFEILSGCAADGAFLRGLDALQLLAARAADHRYGHRRVRGLAVFGFYSLSCVLCEVGNGNLARYDVLHGGARTRE